MIAISKQIPYEKQKHIANTFCVNAVYPALISFSLESVVCWAGDAYTPNLSS